MPLTRVNDIDFTIEDLVGVHFVMIDEEGKRVDCRVSWEALQDRDKSLREADTFLKYRKEIERVASRLYDSGAAQPFVTSQALGV